MNNLGGSKCVCKRRGRRNGVLKAESDKKRRELSVVERVTGTRLDSRDK